MSKNEQEFIEETSKFPVEETIEPPNANNSENIEETVETEPETAVNEKPGALKDAWKQVESFGQMVGDALQSRSNVVMVRVNDEALRHLDMLTEAEITKSRSESAAFLIHEGIKANQELFSRISEITQQIEDLRHQLREAIKKEENPEE